MNVKRGDRLTDWQQGRTFYIVQQGTQGKSPYCCRCPRLTPVMTICLCMARWVEIGGVTNDPNGCCHHASASCPLQVLAG